MAQTIDTKLNSLNVQKYLNSSQEQVTESIQKTGSGLRINSAQDDAAGLAIAERMNTLVRGLNVSIRNASDGISMAQVAEGGLDQVNDVLQRMRELAVQSANGANSSDDRANLNAQYRALNSEISQIASATKFNGEAVLANAGSSVDFQVGPNVGVDETLSVDLVDIKPLSSNIETYDGSLASIAEIDSMIAAVSNSRAQFGSTQNLFESTIANLQEGVENQSAARGRIMDADFAMETARLTHSQILQQAGTAISSQANVTQQSVMQLLE